MYKNFSDVLIRFLLTQHVKHKKNQLISVELIVLQKINKPRILTEI